MERSEDPRERHGRAADSALMADIAAGDRNAFSRLVREESPRLIRFAAGMLVSLAEAEEVAQESFLRLWLQAAEWRPDARIGTWLHRVAYNLAVDRLRRRRPQVDVEGMEDVLRDDSQAQDERLAERDELARLQLALDGLPLRQRTALSLCHFQGLRQSEAAAVMGIGEAAYESLLARARRRLRAQLAPEEEDRTP